MTPEILDADFSHPLTEHLEEDEIILWDDRSKKESFFSINRVINFILPMLFLFYFFGMLSVGLFFSSDPIFFLVFLFLFVLLSAAFFPKLKRRQQRYQTRYLLTSLRILIQQYDQQKENLNIQSIFLEDIARVSMETNHFNFRMGDLFFLMKNDKKGFVKTYHPHYNTPDQVPTIRQINNPKEVLGLINKELKKIKFAS